ncbi:hypothetical protein HPP92_008926 [Vanilla planifolia]|uniref:Uncharacterized protein n=1 Tax=Vanilla planifolia TaxID=51239 RepID=A0A835R6V0_VANPL|nr:hypothetical protein HPP92_008926 [Vanilla planifolia]
MASSIAYTALVTAKPYFFFRNPYLKRTATIWPRKTSTITASSPSSFRNGSPPETECPVPWDQQPINEYQALTNSFPFSWAVADLRDYFSRLSLTGASFAILLGLPVAAFGPGVDSDPTTEFVRCGLGAASAGLLAVTLAVLRMYLGWTYVGNRLLSATVEYEETGWYDGQVWVKTPEVLARDRLLGSFSVSLCEACADQSEAYISWLGNFSGSLCCSFNIH